MGKILMKCIDYFVVDCISYTVVCALLAVLSALEVVQNMDYIILLQLLFCTTIISFVMFLTNRFLFDSRWKEIVVGLIAGSVVIFVIGGLLFRWFPWQGKYLIRVLAVFLVSYIVTYAVQLYENKLAADKINLIIENRNERV